MASQTNSSSLPWSELLAGYVLGDLSSDDMIRVQAYLDNHPEAVQEIIELKATLNLMSLGLRDVPVPPTIKDNLLAALPSEKVIPIKQVKQSNLKFNWGHRWRTIASIAGSMAAVTIVGLGLQLGLQSYQLQQEFIATRQELKQLRETQEKLLAQQSDQSRYQQSISLINQPSGRILRLTGSGKAIQTTGTIVIAPTEKRAVLMVKNMPAPPPGKLYHLWAIVNGQKIACIQFTPEADGQVMLQLPADRWSNAVGVVVTIESVQSEAQPVGEMVMSSSDT